MGEICSNFFERTPRQNKNGTGDKETLRIVKTGERTGQVMNTKKILQGIYRAVIFILGRYGIGGFHLIRVAHCFVRRKLISNFIFVQGHKMFLDSKDSLNLSINNGVFEKFETELIKKEIKQGNIVLDIGSNIGYYTLIFAKLVGYNGKVFAFEPDPTNFAILKKNIEINGYKNVVLINKAVSNITGGLKLFLCEDNKGDHRIYDSKDGRKSIEIESVRIDDYFKNLNNKINFIKMDIQGAEYDALKGMCRFLNRNKNVKIITEFCPIGLKRSGVKPIEFLKLLLRYGFKISEVNEAKNKVIPIDTPSLLLNELKEYTFKKENFTNLLCEKPLSKPSRIHVRSWEWTRLEIMRSRKVTRGSNPLISAKPQ
ncbi:hypothetical protein A2961_01665 [Candidatus Woesebacteria bacterium RIFCSPLOWO2_01_FULL_39_21]|uniref:Methyltransferase FkbM domain-containing protein n=1 Tax=Candidatus Woesebacteria bacterium RIFCSPLOWO2_01_FULL_39_21 TaxID=1802519 RepID=A0A1F8BMJ3_9BACT|nr:MAG: hypothetical protein A2691_00965 [Candidatus Woesebacteria bacterium RIFCSPHIGHO2_01_FULL_39_23]OGM65294.1 MAG: hypothetical protein A2961_01665 [Candidatus Woesebacteria bacterium RIFCSPLOWO2_01_FULL_39_21]